MKNCMILVAGLIVLSGCATKGADVSESSGPSISLGGGVFGGGKVATSIISAMNGGLIGGAIGAGLSSQEKRTALEAEYQSLEYTASGKAVPWKGTRSNHRGEVVAAQPYRVGSQDCRQYTHTVFTGNTSASARGTACRNANGSWTPLT